MTDDRDDEQQARDYEELAQYDFVNMLLAALAMQTILDMRSDDGNQPDNR